MENGCLIVESSFIEPLYSKGHYTDSQKTSYVILVNDFIGADCCLATSNNIRNFIVVCVYSVVRCLPVRYRIKVQTR
jgi:hypothetical protein